MMDKTIVLTCGDNYIYVFPYDGQNALVVDPSDASVVLDALSQQHLTLTTVVVTHHHGDHTGGLRRLKSQTACQVVSPDERRIAGTDRVVADGDILPCGDGQIRVIATPGHTGTSVCYYLQPSTPGEPGIVWTGDTLFVGGCGRPMESDASVLWHSLMKLAALPDDTLVYCGHDYTAENYEFALTIEPDNQIVRQRLGQVQEMARQGKPTVPSTVGREKTTNVFLRVGDPAVRAALDMSQSDAGQVFAELRRRKNLFG